MTVIDGPRLTEPRLSVGPEYFGAIMGFAVAQAENGEWAAVRYTYPRLSPERLRAERHENAKASVVDFIESQPA